MQRFSQSDKKPSLKAAETEFEKFRQTRAMYPGAVDVWTRNFEHVAQLIDYKTGKPIIENGKVYTPNN